MNIKFYLYTIKLKNQFTISVGTRLTTPAVIVEIEHKGKTGYGEASLPPYLKENQQSVIDFLKKVNFSSFQFLDELDLILDYVDNLSAGDNAAKVAIDIALHDLFCKINDIPLYQYLNIRKADNIYTSFTIGISDDAGLKKKISSASDYKFLKIKLGTDNVRKIIELISSKTNQKLFVDVHQGWNDEYFALDMINWLAEQNVILVEQPLPKEKIKESIWLKERSPL